MLVPPAARHHRRTQLRLPALLLATMALAGCAMHPASAPQPVNDAGVAVSRDSTGERLAAALKPGDSAATVIPAGTPSPAVSGTEVKRRAIEIFGDSLILLPPPALDSADDGPSWDMDVESYA